MRILPFIAFFLTCFYALHANFVAYVNNPNGGDVTQIPIDPNTGAPTLGVTSPDEGNNTHDLAVTPDGKYIYVTSVAGFLEQFAIDPINGAPVFVGSIFIAFEVSDIAISPDGKNAYIVDGINNEILQIHLDPVTGTPTLAATLLFTSPISVEVAP